MNLKRDQYNGGAPGLAPADLPPDCSVAVAVDGTGPGVYVDIPRRVYLEAEIRGIDGALVAAWSRIEAAIA